jgi:glycosyltransferase involved in cell wall biosynthesis
MFAVQVAVMKGRGGVFTSLFHYARMLEANGVRSVCLYSGPAAAPLREAGIDVIDAPRAITSPLFVLTPAFGRIRAQVRERGGDPDFAMVHSDLAMGSIRRLFPRTIVMTRCHSDNFKHKASADLVVTLNEDQQRRAQAALPRTRVRMFGNPFAPARNEPGPSANDGPDHRIRINFLGRVEQIKDPLTLVEAFNAADLPAHTTLRIIGAGSQDEEVRRALQTSTRPVEIAGWMSAPFSNFDRGDVLVLPSEWESYSWVIREALHHGVPVIASDIYVHREALGDGAYGALFPVGDVKALAAALERITRDIDTARTASVSGRDALMARYGAKPFWAAMAAEIAAIKSARAT